MCCSVFKMFKIACIVVLTVLNFSAGDALICYFCNGSNSSECYRGVQESLVALDCDVLTGGVSTLMAPKRVVSNHLNATVKAPMCFSALISLNQHQMVQRSCIVTRDNIDICEILNSSPTGETLACSSCTDDLCNSKPIQIE